MAVADSAGVESALILRASKRPVRSELALCRMPRNCRRLFQPMAGPAAEKRTYSSPRRQPELHRLEESAVGEIPVESSFIAQGGR